MQRNFIFGCIATLFCGIWHMWYDDLYQAVSLRKHRHKICRSWFSVISACTVSGTMEVENISPSALWIIYCSTKFRFLRASKVSTQVAAPLPAVNNSTTGNGNVQQITYSKRHHDNDRHMWFVCLSLTLHPAETETQCCHKPFMYTCAYIFPLQRLCMLSAALRQ